MRSSRGPRRHRARGLTALVVSGALVSAACGAGDGTTGNRATDATGGGTEGSTPVVTDVGTPGSDDQSEPTPATTPPASGGEAAPEDGPPPTEAVPEPAEAPEILQVSAPLVGGGELDLATVADRPLLLWFWAPF